ncbi:MAG: hemerythrin domain-containing protein [Propionibacteriaceae bacterium]
MNPTDQPVGDTARSNTTWPVQLQLPGQAAAPDGPVDMIMMYVMHHAFRRDLATFAAVVKATPLDDRRTWRALARRWELFATALHHHHTGEDSGLWPLLTARTDDAGRRLLTAMEDEHSQIDPILDACAAGLGRMCNAPDPDVRAALVVRLVAGKESLGRHLAHEETDAIALVQQVMTSAEWDQLEADHFRPQHLSRVRQLQLMCWALHELPTSALERLLLTAPILQRLIWLITRPAFERGERRAFRYRPA